MPLASVATAHHPAKERRRLCPAIRSRLSSRIRRTASSFTRHRGARLSRPVACESSSADERPLAAFRDRALRRPRTRCGRRFGALVARGPARLRRRCRPRACGDARRDVLPVHAPALQRHEHAAAPASCRACSGSVPPPCPARSAAGSPRAAAGPPRRSRRRASSTITSGATPTSYHRSTSFRRAASTATRRAVIVFSCPPSRSAK